MDTTIENKKRTVSIIIPGFSQVIKEKKRGVLKGLWQRMGMILDIIIISFRLYIIFSIKNSLAKKRKKFV